MPPTHRKRPRPGDVIEIHTPKGLAYAQYTHKTQRYGALLRILPGLYAERPAEFSSLVEQAERFLVFFPLGTACSRGIVAVVAEEVIPERARQLPLFRTGIADTHGNVRVWYLRKGEEEWRVDQLTPAQRELPIDPGIWNDTLLIERIANGWTPSERDLVVRG